VRNYLISILISFAFLNQSNASEDWKYINPAPTMENINGISCFSAENEVAVGDTGIILISRNAGSSWDVVESKVKARLTSVFCINKTNAFIVGDSGTILKSLNSGETWNSVSVGTKSYLTKVYFLNDSCGFIVGSKGVIFKTEDGGLNWKKYQVLQKLI
jgi:photosystem II stability/assembly factor-like uncharacterized protein